MAEIGKKKRRILIITTDEQFIDKIQNFTRNSTINPLLIDENDDSQDSKNDKKRKKFNLTCVVCGSSAKGYNFDAITCESCKAFFRRNALKSPNELDCRRQGQCDVTVESRRRCSACRLKKCFLTGMRSDRLLTPEQKALKQAKIEENLRLSSRITNEQQIEMSIDENLSFLDDFDDLFSTTIENQKTLTLTEEELQRLETIEISYRKRIENTARESLPWNPAIPEDTFLQYLNARSISILRLISFFKQIPEFNQLNVSDRVTLIKYNLVPLGLLNACLSYRPETQQIQENDTDAPWDLNVICRFYGQETFLELRRIFQSFLRIVQYDSRIIRLALILLILTKGYTTSNINEMPIFSDESAVYQAQNYYTELLWKYLETVHGQDIAIRIFNDLVTNFISWLKLQHHIFLDLQNFVASNKVDDLSPIMKSVLHIS